MPFTVPEKGGFKGLAWAGQEVPDIPLACRQIGLIHFKKQDGAGDDMFRRRRCCSSRNDVRGCDAKRNVLVYMVYSTS